MHVDLTRSICCKDSILTLARDSKGCCSVSSARNWWTKRSPFQNLLCVAKNVRRLGKTGDGDSLGSWLTVVSKGCGGVLKLGSLPSNCFPFCFL